MDYFYKKQFFSVLLFVALFTAHAGATSETDTGLPEPQRLNDWGHILGFDIDQQEDYMVVSFILNGREQLFESFFDGKEWSMPEPIEPINDYLGGTANIGGPFLNYNASILYFHADYPDAVGGFDIYYSERREEGWSTPKSMGKVINSIGDELYPSVSLSGDRIYFSSNNPAADVRKPRGTSDCQVFYVMSKCPDGFWENPVQLHDVINNHCEYGLWLANDGMTFYYSSVDDDNHRYGFDLYMTREFVKGAWLVPKIIETSISEETNINPRVVGNTLYFLRLTEHRRGRSGSIYKVELPDDLIPEKMITTSGRIIDQEWREPINTTLTVFDPITLRVLGNFESDKKTGTYEMPLLDGQNYIVDIREPGYSLASFQVDYRTEKKICDPEVIELFKKAELLVSVYDYETFRPLEAKVWAEVNFDSNNIINGVETEPGYYSLTLPIGHQYNIKATAHGFDENSFEFDLLGDIIFPRFERKLPLHPIKRSFDFLVSDSETKSPVDAEIIFRNLDREEHIVLRPATEPEKPEAIDPATLTRADAIHESLVLSNLAHRNPTSPFRFALIIGNEDYSSYQTGLESESNVDFAIRDARAFKEYARKILGVPDDNVLFLTNAGAILIDNEINKIENIIRTLEGKAEIFIYFAGHGFPDEQTREPYIMPVDVSGSHLRFAVSLNELYQRLTRHPSERITVFLDACFSGGARNVGLVAARGVRVRPHDHLLNGNIVVFSASSDRQSAHPYREKQHGIFTYYLLSKLKATYGDINYNDLASYLRQTVAVRSIIVNNTEQTPEVNVSPIVENVWQHWIIKH